MIRQVRIHREKFLLREETDMIARPMRWLIHPLNRSGRVLFFGLGLASLVVAAALPASAASLTLTWADSATNEDGFKVERKTGSTGAYGQVAAVAANTTGYVDGSVTTGTTYCYRVRAYNSAGDSAYSNEACAAPVSATLYTVTVGKGGTGSGTVASSPTGITCGSDCSEAYASGTSVALSVTPAAGSTFTGWSGACAGTGTCTVSLNQSSSVTASFTRIRR